ncbi:hypothetical protein K8556_32330 [Corallococcus sp. AS-1-12]|nr:hypothetical protein [Corallococcus sp. AS-1-12]
MELRGIAEVVAQRIEANYGATALPLEVAQTPVPLYVNFMKPPETTLFHALFTSEPWNIPDAAGQPFSILTAKSL